MRPTTRDCIYGNAAIDTSRMYPAAGGDCECCCLSCPWTGFYFRCVRICIVYLQGSHKIINKIIKLATRKWQISGCQNNNKRLSMQTH